MIGADEEILDCFAGGGGASLGIEMALGRSPTIAINHDPEAMAMHEANHPNTRHLCESVYRVSPRDAVGGRKVGAAWFSPDCTYHSRARGGKPFRDPKSAKGRRGLAWQVTRWAREVRPRFIALENVVELLDWCPSGDDGRPDYTRRGLTFRRWVGELKACGYEVDWRQLRACDYGTPTTRKRLFLIARCDGLPLIWPVPTHGVSTPLVPLKPYRTAAECIDFDIPARSIFDRKKPLAEKTLARIARGIRKFVIESGSPFVIPLTHGGDVRVHGGDDPLPKSVSAVRGDDAVGGRTLIPVGYGEREGQDPRALDIREPLGTLVAGGVKHRVSFAFLAKHYGGNEATGSALHRPIDTITTQDHHALVTAHTIGDRRAEVRAFLAAHGIHDPIVRVNGQTYEIADITSRMLEPRELFRAQGFHDSYVIDPIVDGKPLSKTAQVRMCGNSAPPPVVAAIIRANCQWQEDRVAA